MSFQDDELILRGGMRDLGRGGSVSPLPRSTCVCGLRS